MYEITVVRNNARTLLNCCFIFVTAYAALYLCVGGPFDIPHGRAYALVLVWAAAHLGAALSVQIRMPPLLGMLLMGILLKNANSEIIGAYTHQWQKAIKSAGLATIMLRAGLKIDYAKAFQRAPATTMLLGLLPVLADGFVSMSIFKGMLSMPFVVAGLGGFVVAPISPTVMITGMLALINKGLGTVQGIPSVEMASAGIDVVTGLAGYSIFEGQALTTANAAWGTAKGPVQVGLGFVAGIIAASCVACTKLWHLQLPRSLAIFTLAQMMVHLFNYYKMTGGGALAAICTGGAAALMWDSGFPGFLSVGPRPDLRKRTDHQIAVFWDWVMQPLLFGTIGAGVDISKIQPSDFQAAMTIIFCGMLTRWFVAFFCLLPAKFAWKEHLFVMLTWIPKATVQGVLASAPLDAFKARDPDSPDYERYLEWGNAIQATAVLMIFITAPIGMLIQSLVSPVCLQQGPISGAPELPEADLDAEVTAKQPDGQPGQPPQQPLHPFLHRRRSSKEPVGRSASVGSTDWIQHLELQQQAESRRLEVVVSDLKQALAAQKEQYNKLLLKSTPEEQHEALLGNGMPDGESNSPHGQQPYSNGHLPVNDIEMGSAGSAQLRSWADQGGQPGGTKLDAGAVELSAPAGLQATNGAAVQHNGNGVGAQATDAQPGGDFGDLTQDVHAPTMNGTAVQHNADGAIKPGHGPDAGAQEGKDLWGVPVAVQDAENIPTARYGSIEEVSDAKKARSVT